MKNSNLNKILKDSTLLDSEGLKPNQTLRYKFISNKLIATI